jgi:hypothetical protein
MIVGVIKLMPVKADGPPDATDIHQPAKWIPPRR